MFNYQQYGLIEELPSTTPGSDPRPIPLPGPPWGLALIALCILPRFLIALCLIAALSWFGLSALHAQFNGCPAGFCSPVANGGGGSCSNKLDFTQACNSKYIPVMQ